MDWRAKTGRIIAGVEIRVVDDDGAVMPSDGGSVGEFEVRGPWVTASYYGDPAADRFHDGWLRTGDVGSLDDHGYMQISDRTKDVIKSGGEWISSVELENAGDGPPRGVRGGGDRACPTSVGSERPLVVVVAAEGAAPEASELLAFLSERVARWWLPERWAFVDEIPKTSVGKFDKKVLRVQAADGVLDVVEVDLPSRRVERAGSGEGGEHWWVTRSSPTAWRPSPRSSMTWPSTVSGRPPARPDGRGPRPGRGGRGAAAHPGPAGGGEGRGGAALGPGGTGDGDEPG